MPIKSSVSRYRYPGLIPVSDDCCKPIEPRPFKIIKPCPPKPFIKDKQCKADIFDRAIIRYVPVEMRADIGTLFLLETFRGLVLYPTNLSQHCGVDVYKDGDCVAIEAEKQNKTKCGYIIPCKIFTITKIWNLELRSMRGVVRRTVDLTCKVYYKITETYNMSQGKPFFYEIANPLLFEPINIDYEIFNIMGTGESLGSVLGSLDGRTIDCKYVDYGNETRDREGLPIVILEYGIV